MTNRIQELKSTVERLYDAALEDNPNNIDKEVTILYDIRLILNTLDKVGNEEKLTKLNKLGPKIREGLSLKQER
jgi:hypothetical protein